MSRPFSRFLALSAIGLLCFQLTLAQQTNSTTADKNADAARKETELRDKAYELLSSLADQISTLQSAENRARIGFIQDAVFVRNRRTRQWSIRGDELLFEDVVNLQRQRRHTTPPAKCGRSLC